MLRSVFGSSSLACLFFGSAMMNFFANRSSGEGLSFGSSARCISNRSRTSPKVTALDGPLFLIKSYHCVTSGISVLK
ncbi:hypothetical protein EDB19DRAFT_1752285 [Suillus lakei]|nr:hypothetical protein EDB19DRAFT_1752285 [Suillus lakei]